MPLPIPVIGHHRGLRHPDQHTPAAVAAAYAAVFAGDPTRPPECPPCFDCNLPVDRCLNFGTCSAYSGKCECPVGFGKDDCATPLCDSPALPNAHRAPRPEGARTCDCADGWTGLNCNMCRSDSACNALIPGGQNGTCYASASPVHANFFECNVTNPNIVQQLGPDQLPQATMQCHRDDAACQFQFWIGGVQSFACRTSDCTFISDSRYDQNITKAVCSSIQCDCVPGRMLCDPHGVDLSDWFSDDEEGPTGPGQIQCEEERDDRGHVAQRCRFEEPHMNQLIQQLFGEAAIELHCQSSECLHYSEIPGYTPPSYASQITTWTVILGVVGILGIVVILEIRYTLGQPRDKSSWNRMRSLIQHAQGSTAATSPSPAAAAAATAAPAPAEPLEILKGVSGMVRPGEVMAIIGASGAAKTTLLDILACRNKSGRVHGDIRINGRRVSAEEHARQIGYVDQEPTLMETLTVYETIRLSAQLRLPRTMSEAAKKQRVHEVMLELGILHIGHREIGSSERRGISGGEKRRVAIACELVTSPALLFLDEPTSGLDAWNSLNVVSCLVALAHNYRRTIILTIHQPRSNIYALFDQLVLLAQGQLVYSGPAQDACLRHFAALGAPCPLGFNLADFVVDLTVQAVMHHQRAASGLPAAADGCSAADLAGASRPAPAADGGDGGEGETASSASPPPPLPDLRLDDLVHGFRVSERAVRLSTEIARLTAVAPTAPPTATTAALPPAPPSAPLRVGWTTQFALLSGRAFRNLYRAPDLLRTQYIISVGLGFALGTLFWGVQNDIAGFQNRLGVCFFVCALFGFQCLSNMQGFAVERLLFMRERANGYYRPSAYFASKVLVDLLPLRVLPPFILGLIVYHMVGLRADSPVFLFKFLLVLVLFNVTAAALCLAIAIMFSDPAIASFVAILVMLFEMLFGGLLLNKETIPQRLAWLNRISFFNRGLEALVVNEINGLTLYENRYGLMIDVPGAAILQTFGFNAMAYWQDVAVLAGMFLGLVMLGYMWLRVFVMETR
ncbi:hypothetical protein CXG81DRAFT_11477 [Caulochytrium protostelioides]|uniref:ABC transporter domain-containing protein n=1 Tax=Caulochytrium protostelioides TaxID=1555241 RepID=A0A4P9X9S2_9FUNG|nr:hypothetical protein CXG81DRAFT_11477 [Caulochytrium protostelioides]|eukprot:RKP01830.1 hypothetical protein CXG81DRAFT_11477 [Caulochytrium protostelioides]